MNCHEDNKGNHSAHKHNPLKHMLHMVICCGLPIIVFGLLPVISRYSPSVGNVIGRIVPFICPIMMIMMMPMMMGLGNGKKGGCCGHTAENSNSSKSTELNNTLE